MNIPAPGPAFLMRNRFRIILSKNIPRFQFAERTVLFVFSFCFRSHSPEFDVKSVIT